MPDTNSYPNYFVGQTITVKLILEQIPNYDLQNVSISVTPSSENAEFLESKYSDVLISSVSGNVVTFVPSNVDEPEVPPSDNGVIAEVNYKVNSPGVVHFDVSASGTFPTTGDPAPIFVSGTPASVNVVEMEHLKVKVEIGESEL